MEFLGTAKIRWPWKRYVRNQYDADVQAPKF